MVSCVVLNCKNSSAKINKNKDGISFHRFPRDPDRRRKWEIAVNRHESWLSTRSSVVCSEHFDTNDFYLTERCLRRLSIDSVPCINISVCQPPEPTISHLLPVDITPTDSEEVIKLKFKVRRLEVIADNRKGRIHHLWQARRRLRKKISRMKCIIKHLIRFRQDNGLGG